MIAKDLHLRRRKDGVGVITLAAEKPYGLPGKNHTSWNQQIRAFVPVRYVKSGRKGYIRADVLDTDWIVIGKADPNTRWAKRPIVSGFDSAAALEDMRERDIVALRKYILKHTLTPGPDDRRLLEALNPSPNAISALDRAIHMILSGV